ncbi:hypothetical protein [Deinococcus fonticola]|uniref:hypothetical protein n=1 Tax=Deinococcus fonticola TaxID=2528713 RepID=UPI0010753F21|nr:hypothetical protein [Deinococcus fonticola]
MNPALLAVWRYFTGYHLIARNQVQTAYVMLALGIFLVYPSVKPSLWILDYWGGLEIPLWVWGTVFIGVGASLLMARRPSVAYVLLMISAVLLGTIGAAGYLTMGMNAGSVVIATFTAYTIGTAAYLKRMVGHDRS